MSEVLITLGIIGVISILTVPTLVNRYQEKAFTVRWQKIYSILSNGYEELKVENGNFEEWEQTVADTYSKFKSVLKIYRDCPASSKDNVCFPDSVKYQTLDMEDYKISSFNKDIHNSSNPSFILTSGEIIKFVPYLNTVYLIADVNGQVGPNVLGKDTFIFSLSQIFVTYEEVDGKNVVKESWVDNTDDVIPGPPFRWSAIAKLCNPNTQTNYIWYNGASCGFWLINYKNMDYLHLSLEKITEYWVGWK